MDLIELYTNMTMKIIITLMVGFIVLALFSLVVYYILRKKKCVNCKEKIDKDSIYCKYCGKEVK